MENHSTEFAKADSSFLVKLEMLQLVFNNLDGTFLLVGKDLRIVYTNELTRQRIQELFGVVLGPESSVLDIAPPSRHKDLINIYKDVFDGVERRTEIEVPGDDGPSYFENIFKPAKNSSGEIVAALITSRNITENKRAEKQLKEIEERWRFALEGGNQGVWDWDLPSGDVFYSDSYKRLYGYEDDELKGRIEEWSKMIHPDDQKIIDKAIKEHLSSTNPYYESTYRIKSKTGDYKWILARGMLISKDKDGNPVRMIGTHTDITKQVNAEETYKILFYSNPLPMWTYSLKTLRFTAVNDAAVNHYGYSKEEFFSMTINDIRPEEDVEALAKVLRSRESTTHNLGYWRHRKKSGEIIFVEVSTHKLDQGNNNEVLVVSHNITSQIIAEEKLKKSNERFLIASRATSDAIWDWDLLTDELFWGEGLQTLFGFHPNEVPITMWENLIHPDDRQRIHDSIFDVIENSEKTIWKDEYRFTNANGSFRYVLDRGFVIRNDEGKAVRMIGSMQDITELKYNEQILSLERSVLELSNNPNIEFTFLVESLLKGVEEIHEDAFTSVLLLREDETVQPFIAPRIPVEFTQKIDGLKIGPEEGSCGAAMFRKESIIVNDIDTHPLWKKYKSLALLFDFHACWSLPIVNSLGKVLGSFSIYFKKIKTPSAQEINTFERIKNMLRILMEHHWSLNEIKIANERFDVIMKATHDLIWDWNLEGNTIYREPSGLAQVYGVANNKCIETIERWLTRIHSEDLERVQNMIAEIIQAKDQDTFEIEYRFQKDDFDYTYVYDRGKIIRDDHGKPIRMIGAAQNINYRKHLEQELLRNELEKQKAINQATVDSQEQERTEIGKELHDNVNQVLTTTKLYLDLAMSNQELKDELIVKSTKNIISVINEIRQLSRSLMDPTIGDLGLIDSLNDLIENINLTRKLQASLKAERRLEFFLNKNHKLTIFRIVQEALNNAVKYANAKNVWISCKLKGEEAEVVIEDDGIGFDPSLVRKGAGLKNIQNRIYLISGTYKINTAPNQGCQIIINFPLFK